MMSFYKAKKLWTTQTKKNNLKKRIELIQKISLLNTAFWFVLFTPEVIEEVFDGNTKAID